MTYREKYPYTRISDKLYQAKKRKLLPKKKYLEVKVYIENNRDKVRAWGKVRYALGNGTLIKKSCEICGIMEKVQAHHEDYAKPLDVIWLCPSHHKKTHLIGRNNKLNRSKEPKK